jgi:hypothetical protein
VAIPAAQEHQWTQRAGVHQCSGLLQRWMVAMVEADTDEPAGLGRCGHKPIDLADRPCRGFLEEDVLAGAKRPQPQRRQRLVGGRDDCDFDLGTRERRVDSLRNSARVLSGQGSRARGMKVSAGDQLSWLESRRTLSADQAATEDGDAGRARGHERASSSSGEFCRY